MPLDRLKCCWSSWLCQNNPVVEYQAEGFRMFNDMIGSIEFDVTRLMMKAQIHEQERPQTEHHISTTATRNIAANRPIFK